MGRTRRITRPETANPSNSLVASAVRVSGAKDYVKFSRTGSGWQKEAWEFYNTIGEYRYACDWVGSMLSKAILYATDESSGKVLKVEEGAAFDYVDQLFGDTDGKAEMLRTIGIHFTVAGECWLFATDHGDEMKWQVAAASEVTQRAKKWYIGGNEIESDGEPLAIRLWRPHPQKPMEANSPSRSVLSILAEISKLTQHVSAQVDSRLAGAGVFAVPSEMTFPVPPSNGEEEVPAQVNAASTFMRTLQEAMATAIKDRGDASALVPIVVTAPGEHIDKMRHITFWSELDRQAVELRNEAIRRLALGMDMPPEVLMGVADSNHWAAWQADESAIKGHTEPLLKIITSSLAEGYLRPLLEDDDAFTGDIAHFSIGADTSQLRLRPNRSKEALELYDRGELDGDALRRETGFEDNDKPDEEEMRYWFLRKVASGSTTPELVEAALRSLGLFKDVPQIASPSEETQEERPTPSLVEHPTRDLPERSDPALVAACEQIVHRALERAGNRMANRMGGKVATLSAAEQYLSFTVKPGDVRFLLEDAFGQNVVRVAERNGIPPQWLVSALEDYTRGLLVTQTEFTYEGLDAYLHRALEEGAA